jgi:hypothetical protein
MDFEPNRTLSGLIAQEHSVAFRYAKSGKLSDGGRVVVRNTYTSGGSHAEHGAGR